MCPYNNGACLCPLQSDAADALSRFYYPPVAAVTISYPKEAIRKECLIDGELQGFGQLHPRSQGVETLGISFNCVLSYNIYRLVSFFYGVILHSSMNFVLFR